MVDAMGIARLLDEQQPDKMKTPISALTESVSKSNDQKQGETDPATAYACQHKLASETKGQVGRVSPRPPDRGHSCTLFGREPVRESRTSGLTTRWVAGDPAVSERPPYLRARQT